MSRGESVKQLHRLLIIMPRQLGDVLLTTPFLKIIKDQHPDCKIDWYAHPMAKQILDGNAKISHILYHPKGRDHTKFVLTSFWEWLKAECRLLMVLRKNNYDAVVDVMNNPRTAIASFFTKAPIRISFRTRVLRNLAFTHLMNREEMEGGYIAGTRLKLLAGICKLPSDVASGDYRNVHTELAPSEGDIETAMRVLEKAKLKTGCEKFVVMSPTHRRTVRQWPHYVALARKLIVEKNVGVIWLWGPGEENFVKQLHEETLEKSNSVASYMPEEMMSLRSTGVLCAHTLGFLGNSNGLSHVAVACGAKSVEIHGSTDARVWTHPDTENHMGVQAICSCMGSNTCQFGVVAKCMRELSVNEVFAKTIV